MCYQEITCPRCSSRQVRKNGKTLQRKQRFQCTDCFRQFIIDYTNLGCLPEIRSPVIVLTLNGCGVRDLQRALHVSTNTVLKTIREAAAEVPEPAPAAPHPDLGTR
jgi:transposase-like protein